MNNGSRICRILVSDVKVLEWAHNRMTHQDPATIDIGVAFVYFKRRADLVNMRLVILDYPRFNPEGVTLVLTYSRNDPRETIYNYRPRKEGRLERRVKQWLVSEGFNETDLRFETIVDPKL